MSCNSFPSTEKYSSKLIVTDSSHEGESLEILNMVHRKRWKRLEECIVQLEDASLIEGFYLFYGPDYKSKKSNILHLSCKFRAPTSVIRELVEKVSEDKALSLMSERDYRKRLPLHIAIQYNVSADTISYLVKTYPESLMEKDKSGSNSLHLACRRRPIKSNNNLRRNKHTKIKKAEMKNRREIIKVLLEAYPRLAIEEDGRGINAIEHALNSELDHRIIKMLQNESKKFHLKEEESQQQIQTDEKSESTNIDVNTKEEKELEYVQLGLQSLDFLDNNTSSSTSSDASSPGQKPPSSRQNRRGSKTSNAA